MEVEDRWPVWERLSLLTSASLTLFVTFKLFSLFLVPAHLVLGLFLCVHPLGVLIGARYFGKPEARAGALHAFFLSLCLTVLGLTLLGQVTPTLEPPWLTGGYPLADIAQVVTVCGVLLAPLALMSGVLEYLLLARGRPSIGRYAPSYAILLFGAVLGLVVGYLLLPTVGALGLILLALALAAAGAFRRLRPTLTAVFLLAALLAAWSRSDSRFVLAISPGGPHTTRALVEDGASLGLAVWDPHAYTQVVETRDTTYGAYDNLVYWTVSPEEKTPRGPDSLVYAALAPNPRLAIIGVGGGAQVKDAIRQRSDVKIDAFEINRSVVDYFRRLRPESNGKIFLHDRVQAHAREGRAAVKLGEYQYDGIYLPEAGTVLGYYRALALDLNFIHTEDAYRDYLSQLAPGGVLAAAFAEYSDPDRRMTRRLLASLERLGLSARGFDDGHYRVVIAARPNETKALDQAERMAKRAGLARFSAGVDPLPSDDFGASQILVYSARAELVRTFVLSASGSVLVAFFAIFAFAKRRGRAPGSWIRFASAVGLGASFVLLENTAILFLARTWLSLADAVIVGSALFLAFAMIGARFAGAIGSNWKRGMAIVISAVLVQASTLASGASAIAFAGTLVLAGVCGALVPVLLGSGEPDDMPGLFACDSGGALLGVVVAFFVPLLFGITALGLCVAAAYSILGSLILFLSKNDLSRLPGAAR